MQSAVESIKMTPVQTSATDNKAMEIKTDPSTNTNSSTTPKPEISDLINELKNGIATIAVEMREKFTALRAPPQLIPFQLTPFLT